MNRSLFATFCLALGLLATATCDIRAAFHLWQVKEVFSNADGSVQFIELFDSFNNEQAVNGQTLRANSDGIIKNFTIPTGAANNLPSTATANKHMLFATSNFSSQYGGVTPFKTLPSTPGAFTATTGPFFNPNATTITITFLGSSDTFTFSGASLPKNGYQSLTDLGAVGLPPGTPDIQVTHNTPTNFAGQPGSLSLQAPPGDYSRDGTVDAADYVVWRKTSPGTVPVAGLGADGSKNSTINDGDYDFWSATFGNFIAGGSSDSTGVPEPSAPLLLLGIAGLMRPRRRPVR